MKLQIHVFEGKEPSWKEFQVRKNGKQRDLLAIFEESHVFMLAKKK